MRDNKRRRRISEDEERLLAHRAAAPARDDHHGAGYGAAKARRDARFAVRGCRSQAEADHPWGVTTKSKKTRSVPIPTARLEAVLNGYESTRPGRRSPGRNTSSATGSATRSPDLPQVLGTHRAARARRHPPLAEAGRLEEHHARVPGSSLRIDLHWQDLRHEHASRLVERHVPLAQVRDLLGHASIVTTDATTTRRLKASRSRPLALKWQHVRYRLHTRPRPRGVKILSRLRLSPAHPLLNTH